jgi:HlyD family secretion protein
LARIRKRSIFIAVAVVLAVAAFGLRGRLLQGSAAVVTVEPLAPRSIQASVLASGQLAHDEEVQLTTEEIGKVTAVLVAEGDAVQAGQLVLQIDDQAYRAAVEQNEANVRMQEIAIERQQLRIDNLQTQWQRRRDLHDRGLVDQDSFDAATNDLRIAEVDLESSRESLSQALAQLEQAADRLAKTRAYSPIDGIVTLLDIKVGETAISSSTNIPGSSLMTIANPASIHTEVNVDEADIANIAVGQRAQVYAVAYPDRPIEGKISSISVSAKVAEGAQGLSFAVKIALEDTEGVLLRPGMTCRAEIFTDIREDILAVPIQAILVNEDLSRNRTEYHVFVQRDGKAARVPVEVGISDDAYQEVRGEIEAGEPIIVGPDRALRTLEDGDAVALEAA